MSVNHKQEGELRHHAGPSTSTRTSSPGRQQNFNGPSGRGHTSPCEWDVLAEPVNGQALRDHIVLLHSITETNRAGHEDNPGLLSKQASPVR